MEDQTLAALIDQYLLGTISPQDKAYLEQLMATDPSVATIVSENQLAFKAIQLERNRRLKEKLRALDEDDLKRQGFFSSKSGMLTFVVVTLFLLYYLASAYYSIESIACRNIESYASSGLSIKDQKEMESAWKEAEEAFRRKEYQSAIHRYEPLAERYDREQANVAKWNILMARLAIEGPTTSWKHSLDSFARDTPGVLTIKAYKLSGFFESALGRFFTQQFQEKFSSIKPRLI